MGKRKRTSTSMAAQVDKVCYGRVEKNSTLIGDYLKKHKR